MKRVEAITAKLIEQAAASETELPVTEEMMDQAKQLFDLLSRQEVLALIYRLGNKLGTPGVEISLAAGIRDDKSKMKFEEEVILQIAPIIRKEDEAFEFSLAGRITVASRRLDDVISIPKFRSQSSVKHWMEMRYLGCYSSGEVLSLDADGGGFEIEMVRGLNAEKLAESHGTRLEAIFEELADLIGLVIEEPKTEVVIKENK